MYKEPDLVNKNNFPFMLESCMPCRLRKCDNSF